MREDQTLSHRDAVVFIDAHFPEEGSRLQDDASKHQLIKRATDFAFDDKIIGDIREQCSPRWLKLLYFLLYKDFPSNEVTSIKELLAMNVDEELHKPPDLRHISCGLS